MSKNDFGFGTCFPYGNNEGPCISDDQCKYSLFCGYKNCPVSFGNDDANCCGRNQFKSPNYPNEYFLNDEKTWLITAPVGSIINLQFQFFHVRHIAVFENITNGAKLCVATVAHAPPLFLPCPEILYINMLNFSCPATNLFR